MTELVKDEYMRFGSKIGLLKELLKTYNSP